MTEIKIEKKWTVWPWAVLTLIVIGAIIYVIAATTRPVPPPAAETKSILSVKENNTTVEAFVRFIEESKEMALDHVYTSTALSRLTEAINAMAGEVGVDVRADLGKAKKAADEITADKFSTSHAESIRKATDIQTNALQTIQQAKYPELAGDVADLRKDSAAIKPDVLILDQRDAVKGFFDKAAYLLKKMN